MVQRIIMNLRNRQVIAVSYNNGLILIDDFNNEYTMRDCQDEEWCDFVIEN